MSAAACFTPNLPIDLGKSVTAVGVDCADYWRKQANKLYFRVLAVCDFKGSY